MNIENKIYKHCNNHNVELGILFGVYLGYPECCIDAHMKYDYKIFPSIMIGTGYIPCEECAKKSKEELIATINKHRFCDISFPNCHDLMKHKHFTDMVLYGDLINIATY